MADSRITVSGKILIPAGVIIAILTSGSGFVLGLASERGATLQRLTEVEKKVSDITMDINSRLRSVEASLHRIEGKLSRNGKETP